MSQKGFINASPHIFDCKPLQVAPKDDVAELRRRVAALERERDLLESERNKAFAANRTLTERLRRAGLCTDYRPQPGE